MNNSINSLFSFDTGIYNFNDLIKDKSVELSLTQNALPLDEDNLFWSLSISPVPIKSLDYEIEEMAFASIEDMDGLRTNSFTTLLSETFLSIKEHLNNAKDEKTKQAMTDLLHLLKKNADLASLFQGYSNWLQKA